jgi:putative NIF3 family GTP cyclohydrolase 1 type 2
VLVTGEASFHRLLESEASGIALVLAGHFATERFAVEVLATKLGSEFTGLDVWASRLEQEPSWLVK